jgi:O-antigen/teichoic acid export membrane protein
MSIIREQSVKGTLYSYLGVLLGFVTVAILFPQYLSAAEIGALNLLVAYSMIMAQVASLGFPGAIIKFFPAMRSDGARKKAFLGAILLVTFLGAVLFLLIFIPLIPALKRFHAESAPIFTHYLYMLAPLTLAQLFFINFEAYANVIYKASLGIVIKEFLQRILILLPFFALMAGKLSFDAYVWFYVAALVMSALLLMVYLAWSRNLQAGFSPPAFFKLDWGGMRSLSLYTLVAGFSALGLQRLDGILVNAVYNEALTGIYTTTFYFGTLVLIPGRVINRISHTLVSDAISASHWDRVGEIYRKTSLVQWILGLALVGGLWVHLDNVFRILPEAYASGRWVVIWIALGNLVRMSGGAVDGIIAYSKHYRFNTILVVILLILTVVLVWLLLKPYGISGAALGTFLAVAIFHLLRTVYVQHKFGIQPFGKTHLWVLLIAILASALVGFVPFVHSLPADLILRSLAFIIVFGLPVYLLKLSPSLNAFIQKNINLLFRNG